MEMGKTVEAWRFSRFLERSGRLWEMGTIEIIGMEGTLPKHIGGINKLNLRPVFLGVKSNYLDRADLTHVQAMLPAILSHCGT